MRRKKKAESTSIDLPITPMLDMAFQLLAFFVVSFHPSAMEGQMDMALPAVGEAKAKDEASVDPNATSDTEIELPAEVTVFIKKDDNNESIPAGYIVKGPQATVSPPWPTLAELQSYLVKTRRGLNNKDDVKIQAGGQIKYAYVMEVIDVCRKAEKDGGPGFMRVSFAPPPDLDSAEGK